MGAASEAAPRLPDGQGVPKVRKSDKMAIVRKNRASVPAVKWVYAKVSWGVTGCSGLAGLPRNLSNLINVYYDIQNLTTYIEIESVSRRWGSRRRNHKYMAMSDKEPDHPIGCSGCSSCERLLRLSRVKSR